MDERPISPPPRPDLYVVARFLERLSRPESTYTRSRLQAATKVNYDIFRSYVCLFEVKGWLVWKKEKEKEVARITPAGLEAYHALVGWIRRTLGETMV